MSPPLSVTELETLPSRGFRELTVRVQGAALIVLPRVVDLFLDLVPALSVAVARVIGVAIAAASDGTVALVLNVATILTEAIDPARFLLVSVARTIGAMDPARTVRTVGISLDLILDRAVPALCPRTIDGLGT